MATLESHPERCAFAPEFQDTGEKIRELLFGRRQYRYRILFAISGKTVTVLRVWHGSRDAISREDLAE